MAKSMKVLRITACLLVSNLEQVMATHGVFDYSNIFGNFIDYEVDLSGSQRNYLMS